MNLGSYLFWKDDVSILKKGNDLFSSFNMWINIAFLCSGFRKGWVYVLWVFLIIDSLLIIQMFIGYDGLFSFSFNVLPEFRLLKQQL